MSRSLLRRVPILLALALCGCSTVGVKPWQGGVLARPEMAVDAYALDHAYDDRLYACKEAASGGRIIGGGGGGCN
jgi:hypothetical protein